MQSELVDSKRKDLRDAPLRSETGQVLGVHSTRREQVRSVDDASREAVGLLGF